MRKEKHLLLNEIKEKIDASRAMIITRYEKLAPNLSWQFRDQLTKSGGLFEVVRKKIFIKAIEQAGISIEASLLTGHVGIIFVNQLDAMPLTKLVFKFSEENGKIFEILCGQVEGKLVPGVDLEILAKLPGIDEMRALLLGLFISPMSHMLAVLEAVIKERISVMKQTSE